MDLSDLSSMSRDELVDIKRSLETQIEEARGLFEIAPHEPYWQSPDARLRGMFDEVHQGTDGYGKPPSTVFAHWGGQSIWRYERDYLMWYAAKKAGVKLTEQLNEIYKRKKQPLLKDWIDVIDKYIDRAALHPIPVVWLEEAEICWAEFHHWLDTCPADEHPMGLSIELRNAPHWEFNGGDESLISDNDEPRDEYL